MLREVRGRAGGVVARPEAELGTTFGARPEAELGATFGARPEAEQGTSDAPTPAAPALAASVRVGAPLRRILVLATCRPSPPVWGDRPAAALVPRARAVTRTAVPLGKG